MNTDTPIPVARNMHGRDMAAGVAYFALVFGAGFAMGVVRVLLLVPRLGVRLAELLEMPVMLVVIVLAARFIVKRFAIPAVPARRLVVGFTGLGLAVAAELLVVLAVQKQSLAEYIAGRDPVSGSVFLVMLAVFCAMPFLLARLDTRK